jgi:hypothetical protein
MRNGHGLCEHTDETLGSIKGVEFIHLSNMKASGISKLPI